MKKKILFVIAILIIIAAAVPVTLTIINDNKVKYMEELRMSYSNQNVFFGGVVGREGDFYKYKPINPDQPNFEGIACNLYMNLACYRKETGRSLTYDKVLDYLSQEFEDNGEVRIYTNGRHPEIFDYLDDWADRYLNTQIEYRSKLKDIYLAYANDNAPFPTNKVLFLPVEIIDELIKKEADPNYEMDLKSIQDKYIADGRAVVSEDGKSIEYIAPEK